MYQPDQFVKLTNPDGINKEFKFKDGLNEDTHELNRNEECAKGGLYFCRFKDMSKWLFDYGDTLIWKVEIPEGEEVIEYETKLKAKRIILSDPKKAYDDYEICKMAFQKYGCALRYMKEQTEEICEMAVQQDGWALKYVKEQTEEICKLAVEQNGSALQFVNEQTEEICKLAVQQNGKALQFVNEKTEEICKLAVEQNDCARYFVRPEFRYLFQ